MMTADTSRMTGATSSQPNCQSLPRRCRMLRGDEVWRPADGRARLSATLAMPQALLTLVYESIIRCWAHAWASSMAMLSLMTFWIMSDNTYLASVTSESQAVGAAGYSRMRPYSAIFLSSANLLFVQNSVLA